MERSANCLISPVSVFRNWICNSGRASQILPMVSVSRTTEIDFSNSITEGKFHAVDAGWLLQARSIPICESSRGYVVMAKHILPDKDTIKRMKSKIKLVFIFFSERGYLRCKAAKIKIKRMKSKIKLVFCSA